MRIEGKLKLFSVCEDRTHEEYGEESCIGTIVKHKLGWRFNQSDDWALRAEQLAKIAALLETLK